MEIKIGFTDNPRELVINAKGKKEEITTTINDALSKPTDAKGHTHLIRRAAIAYVEIGSESARPVGFA